MFSLLVIQISASLTIIASVVLLDMSMPVLDGKCITTDRRNVNTHECAIGVGATKEIRQMELSGSQKAARILALTGMSSLEDKQRAFEAGVDG